MRLDILKVYTELKANLRTWQPIVGIYFRYGICTERQKFHAILESLNAKTLTYCVVGSLKWLNDKEIKQYLTMQDQDCVMGYIIRLTLA